MKIKHVIFKGLIVAASFALFSCGNSVVNNSSTDGAQDVGYNPTTSSNLKPLHFDALSQRLTTTFGLANNSDAMNFLNQNRATFQNTIEYNSTYATSYISLMSRACQAVLDEVLFPSGSATIAEPWKKLTGSVADESALALEKLLNAETNGMGEDYKKFALCLGAATSAKATFTNYVAK